MKKMLAVFVMLVLAMIFGSNSCFAGSDGSFVDVAVDEDGNSIAIFRHLKDGNDVVEKIRLDYISENGEWKRSDLIEPSYFGLKTRTFVLPKKIALEHRFNIMVFASDGSAKTVIEDAQSLR
ncbi:MAG: hypothetical protein UX75_C0018G0012 [Candidatus Moranbacteria bacterium GW2011_GWE2_47_10]|nr:MAG: hypothetical protein UX75_C0018G0012 [Candidatus Moranbacteria bacterium GW2011_GWE2_47_10]